MKSTLAIYGIQDRSDNGFPDFVHDHSIVYMESGAVKYMTELERFTQKKHDNSLHRNIYSLLKKRKLINSDLYDVVFVDNVVGRAFISEDGQIRFEASINNSLTADFEKGRCWWFNKEIDGYVLNHELAHIFSCVPFFGNFKDNSLLIHFDGGASLSNFSAWTWKNNKLKNIEYHWDMKNISSLYNANALNFFILNVPRKEHNSLPGKYMGYSSYGNYNPKIEKWLIDNNFFENIWNNKEFFFNSVKENFNILLKEFSTKNKFLQDIAATVQNVFSNAVIKKLKELKQTTNSDFLYYTGGSALNIKTNSQIINQQIFKDVFIPPCTSDTGLALGAAAFMEMKKGNEIKKHSPYLNNWNIDISDVVCENSTIEKIADFIFEGKIIGICNGASEVGPRALGNRSIVARADNSELSKKISMKLKNREWYRPIAPVMLKKNAEYFTNLKEIHHLSKYMLLEFEIPEKHNKELEGVIHVDGTSRIQTINSVEDNEFMYSLLTVLEKKYNIKALINTSFNTKGEPMVQTLDDALKAKKTMNLDYLVYQGKFI